MIEYDNTCPDMIKYDNTCPIMIKYVVVILTYVIF